MGRKLPILLAGAVLLLLLAACSPQVGVPAVNDSDGGGATAIESDSAAQTDTDEAADEPADEVVDEAAADVSSGVDADTVVDEAAEEPTIIEIDTSKYDEFEIVTLLPPDAIPAIDNPQFISAVEADGYYDADELVMGVVFNGEARAYSVPHLSSHEIVNDTLGGVKIAVTW